MGLPHSRTVLVAENIFTPNIDLPTDSYISSSLQVNISATSLNTPPSSTFPSETSTLPFPPLPQKPLNSSPSSAHSPSLKVFFSLPISEMKITLNIDQGIVVDKKIEQFLSSGKDEVPSSNHILLGHKTCDPAILCFRNHFPFHALSLYRLFPRHNPLIKS